MAVSSLARLPLIMSIEEAAAVLGQALPLRAGQNVRVHERLEVVDRVDDERAEVVRVVREEADRVHRVGEGRDLGEARDVEVAGAALGREEDQPTSRVVWKY